MGKVLGCAIIDIYFIISEQRRRRSSSFVFLHLSQVMDKICMYRSYIERDSFYGFDRLMDNIICIFILYNDIKEDILYAL